MKTVFLFPGQGVQFPGMGKDLYEAHSQIRELFEEASDIGGRDWKKVLFEGTAEELKSTDVTQVAVSLVSIAASMALKIREIRPSSCAGFSLGEYPAIYEAGIVSLRDLLHIVDRRGKLLEKVSRTKDGSDGPVGMMAVLGLSLENVADAVNDIRDVHIAIHSSPIQIVLAGTHAGLTAAEKNLEVAGAMKIVRIQVSGPFHSPLLEDARVEFTEILNDVEFADPQIPIFVNTTGKAPKTGAEVKQTCIDQVDHRVRWVDCQKALMGTEPERVLEVGPGKTLSGMWKSLRFGLRAQPAGTLAEIEGLL